MQNKKFGDTFWHEKNGVHFVEDIELLEDEQGYKENLNLTYAVRDGIISHCGEIDENTIKPRQEAIDLTTYTYPNEYAPYTWEACVVKISDKISYIFRDIEDAIRLQMLEEEKLEKLTKIFQKCGRTKINNTIIINEMSNDLCKNSSIEGGLSFSKEYFELLNAIKKFNYENIYLNKRVEPSDRYFNIIIHEIYNTLAQRYDKEKTKEKLEELKKVYPNLISEFLDWITNYWDLANREQTKLKNKIIYPVSKQEKAYRKAIIDYISGMTDNYAIKMYEEIISF